MKLSLKALLVNSLAVGSLAAAMALFAPATAEAQGIAVGVQFGHAYPVTYGPGYDDRFRHEEWRRHEEWVRQQEWLRRQEWVRAHQVYGRAPFARVPFGYDGR